MATHSSILAWTPEVKKPYLFFFFFPITFIIVKYT